MAKIMVYSTPTCPACQQVKEYLKQKGQEFEDIDVSQDPTKAEEMVKRTGQMGVPVIDIDGKLIIGFDKDGIDEALAK